MMKMIDRRKRSKTLSEVKQVKNISNNLQNFLNHQTSHPGLSHTDQEC